VAEDTRRNKRSDSPLPLAMFLAVIRGPFVCVCVCVCVGGGGVSFSPQYKSPATIHLLYHCTTSFPRDTQLLSVFCCCCCLVNRPDQSQTICKTHHVSLPPPPRGPLPRYLTPRRGVRIMSSIRSGELHHYVHLNRRLGRAAPMETSLGRDERMTLARSPLWIKKEEEEKTSKDEPRRLSDSSAVRCFQSLDRTAA